LIEKPVLVSTPSDLALQALQWLRNQGLVMNFFSKIFLKRRFNFNGGLSLRPLSLKKLAGVLVVG
jgi:hypothetical protein